MDIKRFLFIRHGMTRSNTERRYIGNPEEPLCPEGAMGAEALARSGELPPVAALLSGPALRCRQTAEILFPDMRYRQCGMSEIDFGVFKGKNAHDLLGDKAFEAWLETDCMGGIPGGDSVTAFKERCCEEFRRIAEESPGGITAMVVHGGNIMSVLERFALPRRDFYDYRVPNCGFFLCRFENDALIIERKGGIT